MFKNLFRSPSRSAKIYRRYGVCHPVDPNDPGTQITLLPNGVRVATEKTTASALACISLFIEAGPRFETVCNNGVTHLIEHMAYKGFKSMSKFELEEALLYMGAKMTAETTREIQIFSAKCPLDYASNIVDILCKIITDMDINDSSIELEKYNLGLEMGDADNDPKAVTFDYLHQTAFQGTPLAQRIIGPSKNVRRYNKEFVTSFLYDHYQPCKLCLASSGNISHEAMVSYAGSGLGHLVANPHRASDEGPCRFTGSQIIYRDDSMPFAHVAIGFEVPGYGHQDYLTLLVMACICASWDRSQGGYENNGPPLARAASHDLCERYKAFYIPYRDVGLWGVYYVAPPMELEDMLYNIQKQWMQMCTMTQYYDVERGVNLAKLKLAKSIDGVFNSCRDIGMQMMYTCGRKSLVDLYDGLSRIKYHSIREACDKYLYDRCPAVAAVGPTENLPDYTRIRGGQYWIRL